MSVHLAATRPDQQEHFSVGVQSTGEYLSFLASHELASFLQYPSWAQVKKDLWRSETVGWRASSGEMVGGALVLYRRFPGTTKYFAYLPEGPVVDWCSGGREPRAPRRFPVVPLPPMSVDVDVAVRALRSGPSTAVTCQSLTRPMLRY